MSQITFENYGRMAEALSDFILAAGRYPIQRTAEKAVLMDIVRKLDLSGEDRFLDVGCNVGNLLIPLSFIAGSVLGVDHIGCVQRLERRFPFADNVQLRSGNFLDLAFEDRYDKILIYSVLHYLSDATEVFAFVEKAVSLLAPGGKALLGDLPNISHKKRFLESPHGRQFQIEWQRQIAAQPVLSETEELDLPKDNELVEFNDRLILQIVGRLRELGFHAYILPQPSHLPFGHSREDILIERTR